MQISNNAKGIAIIDQSHWITFNHINALPKSVQYNTKSRKTSFSIPVAYASGINQFSKAQWLQQIRTQRTSIHCYEISSSFNLVWFRSKKVTSSASHFLPGKDLEPLLFQSFSIWNFHWQTALCAKNYFCRQIEIFRALQRHHIKATQELRQNNLLLKQREFLT